MRVFDSSDIRNVALIGHGHSGKTALTSAMLFSAAATDRYLGVDEGNSVTDFDEEEIARKLSISSAIAAFPWQKTKFNVIDTPGYNIFLNDTRGALLAADSVVTVIDGVAGVEVSTEKVWQFSDEYKLPRAFFINKLDRERSNFDSAVASIHEAFGRSAVPVQLPLGSEKNFSGIIDVIRMRAYCYKPGGNGKGNETDIPTPYEEAATKAHETLVEMVAEGKDELMEEFFATGTLPCSTTADTAPRRTPRPSSGASSRTGSMRRWSAGIAACRAALTWPIRNWHSSSPTWLNPGRTCSSSWTAAIRGAGPVLPCRAVSRSAGRRPTVARDRLTASSCHLSRWTG